MDYSLSGLVDRLRFRRKLVGTFPRDGKLVRKYQKVRRFPHLRRYLTIAGVVLLAALLLTAALMLRDQRQADQESGGSADY